MRILVFTVLAFVAIGIAACAALVAALPGPIEKPYGLALEVPKPRGAPPSFTVYPGYGRDLAYIASCLPDGSPVFMRRIPGKGEIASVCSRCGRSLGYGFTVVSGCTVKRGCPECLIATWGTAPEDNAR